MRRVNPIVMPPWLHGSYARAHQHFLGQALKALEISPEVWTPTLVQVHVAAGDQAA